MGEQSSLRFSVAGLTDTGLKRSLNEDAFFLDQGLQLALVADGMGGHEAGDVASGLVIEVISDFIYEYDPEFIEQPAGPDTEGPAGPAGQTADAPSIAPNVIQGAVKTANTKIYQINLTRGHRDGTGMGSTFVGLWLLENENRAAVFHVGDSRVYLFRDGKLRQSTKDHSLYQEWLDHGSEGPAPKRNMISRALGPWPNVEADVDILNVISGDQFLLCTDGLSDMVDDQTIEKTLLAHSDMDAACKVLVDLANENGGVDNITVALTRID